MKIRKVKTTRAYAEHALEYWKTQLKTLNESENKTAADELEEDIADLKKSPRDEKKAYSDSLASPVVIDDDLMHIFVELHANAKKACQEALQDELKDAQHNGLDIKYSNTCITGSFKNRKFVPPADGAITIGIHLLDTARKGWFNRLMTGDLANRDWKTLGFAGKNVGILGLKAYVNEFCGERYASQVNEKTVFNGIGAADGAEGDNEGRESFFVTIKYPALKAAGAKTPSPKGGSKPTPKSGDGNGPTPPNKRSGGDGSNGGKQPVSRNGQARQARTGDLDGGSIEFAGIDSRRGGEQFSGRSGSDGAVSKTGGRTGSTGKVKPKIDFSKLTIDDIKPVIGSVPTGSDSQPTKKSAAKKPAAKKTPTKKTPAKKPATKKTPVKKTTPRKSPTSKSGQRASIRGGQEKLTNRRHD